MATNPVDNTYQKLHDELNDLKTFLDDATPKIKPVMATLRNLVPQVDTLINDLIKLMGDIKAAIQKLKDAASNLPVLSQFTSFASKVTAFLTTVSSLLPDQTSEINAVMGIANGIGDVSQLGQQIFTDISNLIDGIVTDLQSLESA